MTTRAMNQLRSRLDRTEAGVVLVRDATAPARPPATVTVGSGVVARATPERRRGRLHVTAETRCGRTVRRYDATDADAAADCAERLVAERDPAAVWLRDRDRVETWTDETLVRALERRLAAAAREADATLVVWTAAEDGGVDDRYDVVLAP